MEIKYYLRLLRHWAWVLILGFVLGGAGGFINSSFQTPVYSASTKVLVARAPQDKTSDLSGLSMQQLANTYVQLLTTTPLVDSVSQRLNYQVSPKNISPQLVGTTQLISIKVEDSDPQRAADIANTLVSVLIEQNEQLQTGSFEATETTLQAQVEQIQKQIDALQGDIEKISLESVQDQIDQAKAQLQPLQDETTRLEQEVAVLLTQNALLETPTVKPLAQLSRDKEQLAKNTALIIEKENRIAQIRPLLDQYQNLYSNLLVLGEPNTSSINQNTTRLTQFQTTLSLYQQIYLNLLNSLESVRLARLQNTPTVTHIEPATRPFSPVRPQPLSTAVTASGVGFLLGLGIVFLIEYLDDTVKRPDDIERNLGLTVLGFIADLTPEKGSTGSQIFVAERPRSPSAEAFRSLRTNLEYSGIDHPLRTLLVTSAGPGEGKTTISANLAAIFAQNGKKVLVLDADLRRPYVHRIFDLPNRYGLTDIFLDRLKLATAGHSWNNNGNGEIKIITTGSLPPNPTEVLGSERMISLLAEMKEQCDVVIVDSPPTVVSDAQVLSARVDGVIIVVWPGHTRMDGVRAACDQFKRVGANVVGVVFNRIPRDSSDYYGGYQYSSGQYKYETIAGVEDSPVSTKS